MYKYRVHHNEKFARHLPYYCRSHGPRGRRRQGCYRESVGVPEIDTKSCQSPRMSRQPHTSDTLTPTRESLEAVEGWGGRWGPKGIVSTVADVVRCAGKGWCTHVGSHDLVFIKFITFCGEMSTQANKSSKTVGDIFHAVNTRYSGVIHSISGYRCTGKKLSGFTFWSRRTTITDRTQLFFHPFRVVR